MALIPSIYWKNKGERDLLAKYKNVGVTKGSVLTVHEDEEAYFYKSGECSDAFGAGRHVLDSANIPVLQKFINLASGGETTYLSEVWFINKKDFLTLRWGAGNLRVKDPYFEIPIKVYANGSYGIRIADGATFIKKLSGTIPYASTEKVVEAFRGIVIEAVKSHLAKFMRDEGIDINEIGAYQSDLGRAVERILGKDFEEYGIELLRFNVREIGFDEEDPGYKEVMAGIAENARLKKLGLNYERKRQLDITETAAGNEGAGTFMGVGMGFGMGQGVGAAVGQMAQQVMQPTNAAAPVPPPPPSQQFYVAQGGQTTGPFSLDALRQMVQTGALTPQTYIFPLGGSAWEFAGQNPVVSLLFLPAPPPPPAP